MKLMPLVGDLYDSNLFTMMPVGFKSGRLAAHIPFIAEALVEGNLATDGRAAAFLAQLAHESGEYQWMEEIGDGSGYEGRSDLGNIYYGDGRKFKGHGPMQITGRGNHIACGAALGLDLINNPRLICTPEHGTRAAAWFWNSRNLSRLADRGWFKEITRRINGGLNGWYERVVYYQRNLLTFGLPPYDEKAEDASIRAFQVTKGLVPDGQVGPKTMAALLAQV